MLKGFRKLATLAIFDGGMTNWPGWGHGHSKLARLFYVRRSEEWNLGTSTGLVLPHKGESRGAYGNESKPPFLSLAAWTYRLADELSHLKTIQLVGKGLFSDVEIVFLGEEGEMAS